MTLYALDGIAPEIDPDVGWIAPTAVLVGRVVVGAEAGIWFGVVARGDNEAIIIGARTNVQENGAKIGQNCLIGAGALITEGKAIPDGSLVVGAPGKVIRDLDEAAIAGLRKSADAYARNARRFASGLVEVTARPNEFEPA